MKITIIAVGSLKEGYWRAAAAEYLKRLTIYAQIVVAEILEGRVGQNAHASDEAKAREREAQGLINAIPLGSVPILLAIDGKQQSSEQWASFIAAEQLASRSHLCFIIGGSTGVAESVKHIAQHHFSLGPLTLPHQLARIVLLEQIYRSFRILRNEPYHK
ncbi:MAG: Ribosomal RNA large subunit methyltransferase H [Firmicutes bacterium]|nr:Ribosomal RNA large subunit methyltransferase H [candidate division NPL-UPA2 bacterium]